MKKVLVVVLILACCAQAMPAQVPSNVLLRVFQIRIKTGPQSYDAGTTFTIEHAGRQYLLTARHVIRTLCPNNTCPNEIEIEISKDQVWQKLKVKVLLPAKPQVDIAVLVPEKELSVTFELLPNSAGVVFGQEVYFLGFPQTLDGKTISTSFGSLRVAFIKRGIISAEDTSDENALVWYIDGFNNPGFSGGPVVGMNPTTRQWHVFGVVQGYLTARARTDINNQLIDTNVLVNSGILIAYDIRHAIKAIDDDLNRRR
jgi:S1-C subfamily serine protease